MSDSITSICCGFVVQHVVTTSCTTNAQQIESQQQVHNKSPQQVVEQTASLTTSWTTCRTHSKSTTSCMQQSASLTTSRTTCCTTNPQLIEVTESDTYGGETQSRNLRKKLAHVSCAGFLHQIYMQVHARSCTRNHVRRSSFLYKSTCTSFLYKFLDCVSPP